MRAALIIGASSGIGAALARHLAQQGGWQLTLAARRLERLATLASELHPTPCEVFALNLADAEQARGIIEKWLAKQERLDLCIITSAVGHKNQSLHWELERETITVNSLGFAAIASAVMGYFIKQESGHLVGISSVAALRGSGAAPAYSASKAFVSIYLDGLRAVARSKAPKVKVTEAMPGFVNTRMMQAERPFWVASPAKAAESILRAVNRNARHAYITRRWGVIAFMLRRLPR